MHTREGPSAPPRSARCSVHCGNSPTRRPLPADAGPAQDIPAVRILPPPDPPPPPPPRQQISLLDPPRGGRPPDRTFFIQNFVEKFREMMRRQGVGRRDPLAPILDMLCEMGM